MYFSNFMMGFGGGGLTLSQAITLSGLSTLKSPASTYSSGVVKTIQLSNSALLTVMFDSGGSNDLQGFISTILTPTTLSAGSTQTLVNGTVATEFQSVDVVKISETSALIAYNVGTSAPRSTYVAVLTISGSTITIGTPLLINSAANSPLALVSLSSTEALLTYQRSSGQGTVYLTISGTSVVSTFETTQAPSGGTVSGFPKWFKLSSNAALLVSGYSDVNIRANIVQISGGSIVTPFTYTTVQSGVSGADKAISLVEFDGSNIICIARGQANIINYTGTVINSVSSSTTIASGATHSVATKINVQQFLCAYYAGSNTAFTKIFNVSPSLVITTPYTTQSLYNAGVNSDNDLFRTSNNEFIDIGLFGGNIAYRALTLSGS